MMVEWANDGLHQANDGKKLVNDDEMLVYDGEMLDNDDHKRAFYHRYLEVNHHSQIWPSLRSCTDWSVTLSYFVKAGIGRKKKRAPLIAE